MSEFLLKPRICFGQDALSVLNEISARSVLLVTDQAMVKFGLAERVTALLRQRGIAWQVWDDVVADPDIATVVRGMKLMDNHYPDLVIALGGGSVIDAAKAVIFSLAQTRPQANRPRPCFVAIPTTSGTGSEARLSGMPVGGKTGTADKGQTGDVVVSFLCFAPADDPQVIMLLTMDTPSRSTGTYVSGGNMVAPTASSIMAEVKLRRVRVDGS